MCSAGKRIRTALGLHPELAEERQTELPLFEHFAGKTKYFGEIGLDGSPRWRKSHAAQKRVFSSILKIASDNGGRVLSIHSRGAVDDVLGALAREPAAGTPVLHWFSGSSGQLQRAIGAGCWFSCGPAMLRTKKGREIASIIPQDRMLTETDGPFATDNSRPLQPVDSWKAVSALSGIWRLPQFEVEQILKRNLKAIAGSV